MFKVITIVINKKLHSLQPFIKGLAVLIFRYIFEYRGNLSLLAFGVLVIILLPFDRLMRSKSQKSDEPSLANTVDGGL